MFGVLRSYGTPEILMLASVTSAFGRVVASIAGAILVVAGMWMLILSRGLN